MEGKRRGELSVCVSAHELVDQREEKELADQYGKD